MAADERGDVVTDVARRLEFAFGHEIADLAGGLGAGFGDDNFQWAAAAIKQ